MMTNEHVVVKAMNESNVKTFMVNDLKFISPSVGAKGARLQRDLADRGLTHPYDTGLLSSLLHAHNNAYLKQIISPKHAHGKVTTNLQISLTEVRDYLFSEQKIFSCAYKDIKFFDTDILATTIGTNSVPISGDVALIPISMPGAVQESGKTVRMVTLQELIQSFIQINGKLRVNKIGATTGQTPGYISRPAHARVQVTSTDPFFHQKYSSPTLLNRVLLNQILVSGDGFGKSGDSGSLVYHERNPTNSAGSGNSTEIYAIGTFVGRLDKNADVFIISPSCNFLVNLQFEFAKTELVL